MPRLLPLLLLLLTIGSSLANADTATIATAANFKPTLQRLAAVFEQQTPHQLTLVGASTGTLFNQIRQGAPFDLLLAADSERPARLEQLGFAIAGSRFTYAEGRLALIGYPAGRDLNPASLRAELTTGRGKLAIANPNTAPYGLAARQALEALALWPLAQGRLVRANNIAQAFQYVDSGNASLGLVAYAQVIHSPRAHWLLPARQYQPIRQQAILLQFGHRNQAAIDFMHFLTSPPAKDIIRHHGYAVAD